MPEVIDDVVELTDARSIRAIAHPARLVVIDRLYDEGRSLTATQAAELAGTTPSAMSYHLRALERFGIVRRADTGGDGRERPWVRAAKDLRIRPPAPVASRAVASATGAVLSMAMDLTKQRLLASLERSIAHPDAVLPLDKVVSYAHTNLLVTPDEATQLMQSILELVEPLSAEQRTEPPEGAGRLTLMVAAAPDTDGGPASTPTNRS
ncbi:MAG TPA: helix-turn-helix domain-containing protein [Acidimicrobiales bacterium]|nr:helix-turn-helix domain-containing protein [Acidimicrobiales bacterium]